MPETATFECHECCTEFEGELPDDLMHVEAWPACCGHDAYLLEVGTAREGEIRGADALDASPPLPGIEEL